MSVGKTNARVSNKLTEVTFNNVAEMLATPGAKYADKCVATLLGYYAPGDGGGGELYYDAGSAAVANGGTVFTALGGGRWLRVVTDGRILVDWFGAHGDGTTNDAVAIQAAIAFGKKASLGQGKVYISNATILLNVANFVFDLNGGTLKAGAALVKDTPLIIVSASEVEISNGTIDGSAELFDNTMSLYTSTAQINISAPFCRIINCLITNHFYTQLVLSNDSSGVVIEGNRFIGTANTPGAADVFTPGPLPLNPTSNFSERGGCFNAIYSNNLTATSEKITITNNYFFWSRGVQLLSGPIPPAVIISNNIFSRRAGIISGGAKWIVTNNQFDPERVPQFNENIWGNLCQCISGEAYTGSIVSNNKCEGFTDFGVELAERDNNLEGEYGDPEDNGLIVTSNIIKTDLDYLPSSGIVPRGLSIVSTSNADMPTPLGYRSALIVSNNVLIGCRSSITLELPDVDTSDDLVSGVLYEIVSTSGSDFSSQTNVTGTGASGDVFEYDGDPVTFGTTTLRVIPNFKNGFGTRRNVNFSGNTLVVNNTEQIAVQFDRIANLFISENIVEKPNGIDAGTQCFKISECKNVKLVNNKVSGYLNLFTNINMPTSIVGLLPSYWYGPIMASDNEMKSFSSTTNSRIETVLPTSSTLPVVPSFKIGNRLELPLSAELASFGYTESPETVIDFQGTSTAVTSGAVVTKNPSIINLAGNATSNSRAQAYGSTGAAIFKHWRSDLVLRHTAWQLGEPYVVSFKANTRRLYANASGQFARIVFGKHPEDTTGVADFRVPFNNYTSGTLVSGRTYYIQTFAAGDDFTNIGGTNVTGNIFVASGTTPTTWTNGSVVYEATQCFGFQLKRSGAIIVPSIFYFSGTALFEADGIIPTSASINGSGYLWNIDLVSTGRNGSPSLWMYVNGYPASILTDLATKSGTTGSLWDGTPRPFKNGVHYELLRGVGGSLNPEAEFSSIKLIQ